MVVEQSLLAGNNSLSVHANTYRDNNLRLACNILMLHLYLHTYIHITGPSSIVASAIS
jgi:hypothetical protein